GVEPLLGLVGLVGVGSIGAAVCLDEFRVDDPERRVREDRGQRRVRRLRLEDDAVLALGRDADVGEQEDGLPFQVVRPLKREANAVLALGRDADVGEQEDGLPFRLIRRLNEKTTSAEVSGVPSAKWTFFFSLKVNVFASFDAVYDSASIGTGCATSTPWYVNSVSKTARLTMLAVGSNARCGSAVLISNDRSITSVPPADERAVAPCAA